MGHETHNPIRQRLVRALNAVHIDPPLASQFHHSRFLTGDEPTLREWVLRHHDQYGLDPIWIFTGIGQPPVPIQETTRSVPVFTLSSIDPTTRRWRPEVREHIDLASSLLHDGRFVVRMEDRSMEPRLRQGGYVMVDSGQVTVPHPPAADALQAPPTDIFALDLAGEGLVLRTVRWNPQTKRLHVTALAPTIPPCQLSRKDAANQLVGRVVWVAQLL